MRGNLLRGAAVKRLRSVFALSAADWRLFLRSVATILWVRLALRVWKLDRLRAWSGRMGPPGRPIERIVWAVWSAGRRLPGTNCLGYALALQHLLARNGHASEVHIGVTRDLQGFTAHAWVMHGGRVLFDTEDHSSYTPLTAWPACTATTAMPLPSGRSRTNQR